MISDTGSAMLEGITEKGKDLGATGGKYRIGVKNRCTGGEGNTDLGTTVYAVYHICGQRHMFVKEYLSKVYVDQYKLYIT